jgi:hypothetical protein
MRPQKSLKSHKLKTNKQRNRRSIFRCQKKKPKKKLKRNTMEWAHTIRLKEMNSSDCVPVVNGAEPDTSWLTMATASRVVIVV